MFYCLVAKLSIVLNINKEYNYFEICFLNRILLKVYINIINIFNPVNNKLLLKGENLSGYGPRTVLLRKDCLFKITSYIERITQTCGVSSSSSNKLLFCEN